MFTRSLAYGLSCPVASFSRQLSIYHLLNSLPSTSPSSEDAHTHHYTMQTGETQGVSLPCQSLKGSLLTLDTETATFANSPCGCLTQCCATPKSAFMNSRRIHLDFTGLIRNQLLCSIWTAPAWQVFRTKTKLEGSSDFLDDRSLRFVGGKEIQRSMIKLWLNF